MKNIHKQDGFEQAWQKALMDAEMEPSSSLWQRVEAGIATGQASMYRRRLVYFKWVAAASVVLSIGLGVYIWYEQEEAVPTASTSVVPEDLARSDAATPDLREEAVRPAPEAGTSRPGTTVQPPGRGAETAESSAALAVQDIGGERPQAKGLLASYTEQKAMEDAGYRRDTRRHVQPVLMMGNRQWRAEAPLSKPLLPAEHIYRTPAVMPRSRKRDAPVQLLAGLKFSTGRFDPGYEASGTSVFQSPALSSFETVSYRNVSDNLADNTTQLSGESFAPAASFSYGFNFGARIAARWILQTGLNYIHANSWARTSAYYQDPSTLQKTAVLRSVHYQKEGVVQVVQTDRIQLRNTFDFASIPLKAGYLVLDSRVNLALLAGVSADFLLQNTVSDRQGLLEDFTTGSGQASPYRSMYYNGSVSTALGAVVADRYHLSVEPGYRIALTDLTKDAFSLNSRPNAFYVSFGINYRFR